MWDIIVVVLQSACVALLLAGALISIWILWTGTAPVQKKSAVIVPLDPAQHEAPAHNEQLKRAA
jgi:hypothetical protein